MVRQNMPLMILRCSAHGGPARRVAGSGDTDMLLRIRHVIRDLTTYGYRRV